MASRLNSPLVSRRLSSVVAFNAAASPILLGSTPSHSPGRPRKNEAALPATAPRLRRSLSTPRSEHDLRLEVFFHISGFSEFQRLRAHRSLSLISLRAMLQREFGVPFEDQELYFHGDLLEGDEELASYEIQDKSVLNVRITKRYRSIGDIFTKIKVVRFPGAGATKSHNLHTDDYELVEVVAALPPLPIVLRRLGIAIAYITTLDRMQYKRTNRRVWRQHINCCEEPVAALASTPFDRAPSSQPDPGAVPLTTLLAATAQFPAMTLAATGTKSSPIRDESVSFVMRKCSPERASSLLSIAHAIHERLQIPPESRSAADVRHIRKWLGSVKYFASAGMPDAALHEIARSCVYERYQSGDFIFRQGDMGDFFYILLSGCIALAAYGNGFFATMTPGMCFGEISLFEARGVRTASANVDFAAPFAELAVLSGDVYRRVINPHKQAVLHRTEKAVYSVPQLRLLPDNLITHVAYASKSLAAKTGKRLIRHGDDVRVLVLLVAGAVKVSTPRPKKHQSVGGSAIAKFKPSFHQERTEKPLAVVSVVHAPAVFGQEGCLTNTPQPAPWDIDALDTCTLICLRMDTVSIFLSPRQEIIRALVAEHQARIEDFRRRFEQYAVESKSRRSSTSSVHKQASYLKLLSSTRKLLLSDADPQGESRARGSPRMRAASRIEFPKVLMKDEHIAAIEASPTLRDTRSPKVPARDAGHGARSTLRSFFFGSRGQPQSGGLRVLQSPPQPPQPGRSQSAPTCAELQDQFLHHALPHSNMLGLREQIQFVSFAQQQADWGRNRQPRGRRQSQQLGPATSAPAATEEPLEAKTRALLNGLRRLRTEDVAMAPTPPRARELHPQFHFLAASSSS
ncbi:hypothetical protein PybrP1_000395 [[Pythium] brassicae (nom. inval.)]|nr:hypothetical protein PybrP1_000395 [[Pythium] brassicae (nom. inval.)]